MTREKKLQKPSSNSTSRFVSKPSEAAQEGPVCKVLDDFKIDFELLNLFVMDIFARMMWDL